MPWPQRFNIGKTARPEPPGQPEQVWPVRGALAPSVPGADLYLSPDHALFLDGVLVPVKYPINGTSTPSRRPRWSHTITWNLTITT